MPENRGLGHFLPKGFRAMKSCWNHVKCFAKGEEGATMVEYGLMLALIAIVAMAGAALIGTSASTLFTTTSTTL
jgi:pilus assembly protein Flp/PilA